MDSVPGVPCWVSLTVRDRQATEEFYSAVLGWSFADSPLGSGFRTATREGKPVAGFNEAAVSWQLPVRWTVFFSTPDADLACDRVHERGATVAVGPLRVGEGRAAMVADPQGAPFGLWQGELPRGWEVGAEHAPAWLELHTSDAFAAALFYGEVLDWTKNPSHGVSYEEQHDEVHILVDGETVAGLRGGGIEAAPDSRRRTRWDVYFRAHDIDAALAAVERTGGSVLSPVQQAPHGRYATVRDPDGGLFSLLGP
ncbi:VOC family protein [Streptomyces sp. enrichment culture]|uniref:VOC family protein n=1 Tax=Streptomyces sp. enrichment culture TaxID=1795815 RepID=UPI003F5443C0